MVRHSLKFTMIVMCVFCLSCSKRPDGMPKTYSCTIKVIKDSAPVEGANIVVYAEKPFSDLVTSGITDSSGNAKLVSLYKNVQVKGIPEGSYKMVVTKQPFLEHTKTPDEIVKMSPGEQMAYEREFKKKRDALPKIVPDALTKRDTTPLKVEVTTQGGNLEVDLSKY